MDPYVYGIIESDALDLSHYNNTVTLLDDLPTFLGTLWSQQLQVLSNMSAVDDETPAALDAAGKAFDALSEGIISSALMEYDDWVCDQRQYHSRPQGRTGNNWQLRTATVLHAKSFDDDTWSMTKPELGVCTATATIIGLSLQLKSIQNNKGTDLAFTVCFDSEGQMVPTPEDFPSVLGEEEKKCVQDDILTEPQEEDTTTWERDVYDLLWPGAGLDLDCNDGCLGGVEESLKWVAGVTCVA